jgi:chromosome segregation ATPase
MFLYVFAIWVPLDVLFDLQYEHIIFSYSYLSIAMNKVDKLPSLQTKLHELERRKKRWIDSFEVGSIAASDYTDRTASLSAQIDTAQNEIANLETYFNSAPPHEVNAKLRGLIERIEIAKSGRIKIIWL